MLACCTEYLWQIPAHQEAWVKLSASNARLYEQFCHFLETDSIHLLDEAMKLLPEVTPGRLSDATDHCPSSLFAL